MTWNQRKHINEHCESVWWQPEWFVEVAAFCHLSSRYFDRSLQRIDRYWRQACLFYMAPGLICEGYWQVNSWRSIFFIVDPTLAVYIANSSLCWNLYVLTVHGISFTNLYQGQRKTLKTGKVKLNLEYYLIKMCVVNYFTTTDIPFLSVIVVL